MSRDCQTDDLLVELYNMTLSFTRILQPQIYKQYRGDIEDLAGDFFTYFITPTGRKKKQTLLDSYDGRLGKLPSYVKVCVSRKLMDEAYYHPYNTVSIDALTDEYGDCITHAFDLTDKSNPELPSTAFIKKRWAGLKASTKNSVYNDMINGQSSLLPHLSPEFKYYNGCPIWRVTDLTLTLYHPTLKRLIVFSTYSGLAKGEYRPFSIPKDDPILHEQYNSYFEKDNFLSYCQEHYK